MANQKHLERLKQGVDVWNEWREENLRGFLGGADPDLSAANRDMASLANRIRIYLSAAYIDDPNLSGADLSRANLSGANLLGADLSRANLLGANLLGADLREANLSGANLLGADLSRADLREAKLLGADLSRADLREANLIKANLSRADLSGADLRKANLGGAKLLGADLCKANLSGAKLLGADLHEANLSGANLLGADLHEANLSEANLSGANLSGANLIKANLIKANLIKANLIKANLIKANLSGADLHEADLHEADLHEADLHEADLREAKLLGADLSRAEFHMTYLYETIIDRVDLCAVKGLDTVIHLGPSPVNINTVQLPEGKTRIHFLRGVGFSDALIEYLPSLLTAAIQYASCFISYAHQDEALAQRLYKDLQDKGVRCWMAPHDLQPGDYHHSRIDEAIHLNERVLLLLSQDAVTSSWVKHEVQIALAKEIAQDRIVLFPLQLDEAILLAQNDWAARLRESRHIRDFSGWQDDTIYLKRFEELLHHLKVKIT
jgi:uncharacterized protein YjbI with pentapeptide repeats